MLNVGDTIEIGGRNAFVCFTGEYDNEKYICVAFENEKIEYDIYKYKYENDKLLVSNKLNEDEIKNVLGMFISEGLEECELSEEMNQLIDKVIEKNESDKTS